MNIKEKLSDMKDIIVLTYQFVTKRRDTTFFDKNTSLRHEIHNMFRRKRALSFLQQSKSKMISTTFAGGDASLQHIRAIAQQNFNKPKEEKNDQ